MDFTELRHLAEQIETECGKAIIGKGEQIRLVLQPVCRRARAD